MCTNFNPELELPVLQQWFRDHQHPSVLQGYVEELNSIESRRGWTPLSESNMLHWFNNARAGLEEAKVRSPSQGFYHLYNDNSQSHNSYARLMNQWPVSISWYGQEYLEPHSSGLLSLTLNPRHSLIGSNDNTEASSTPNFTISGTIEEAKYDKEGGEKCGENPEIITGSQNINNCRTTSTTTTTNKDSWQHLSTLQPPLFWTRHRHWQQQQQNQQQSTAAIVSEYDQNKVTNEGGGNETFKTSCPGFPFAPNSMSSPVNFPSPTPAPIQHHHPERVNSRGNKKTRVLYDLNTEVPKLEQWFARNSYPDRSLILKYTDELNQGPKRQRQPLDTSNVMFWFQNRRQKAKKEGTDHYSSLHHPTTDSFPQQHPSPSWPFFSGYDPQSAYETLGFPKTDGES